MENEIEVGYSQRTAGANGLITSADCIGAPSVVAMEANVFAAPCYLYQRDPSTGFATKVWRNDGTPAVPSWTLVTTGIGEIATVKVSIPTASVLTLNGTPVQILPAPGAGSYYQIIAYSAILKPGTVTYTTNTGLRLYSHTNGIGAPLVTDNATLAFTHSTSDQVQDGAISAAKVTENDAVDIAVATGNPAAGDSDLEIEVSYIVRTV